MSHVAHVSTRSSRSRCGFVEAGSTDRDVRLRDAHDEEADTFADGRAATLTVSRPGAVSRLRFPADAGRRVTVEVTPPACPTGAEFCS
ncbi:hypothetical protein PSH03_002810 [Micromonospora sp. PSH03]|uniref:hypothetical protein n=1 Tax=Micromonospora TaxID=1873 RepID=UPI001B38D604|nr:MULTISPECIES: hypothetical protein [Micromonospora]MBQ0992746.1 hypothetical protein [Micromonospora sp. H61]MCG5457694.1 hypothetical protein [Micromonospora salmantinae]